MKKKQIKKVKRVNKQIVEIHIYIHQNNPNGTGNITGGNFYVGDPLNNVTLC